MLPGISRAAALVVLSVSLMACEAGKLYRQGKDLEQADQDVRAAESYLDALDARPSQKRSNKALNRMAEEAYTKLLKVATEHEEASRYPDAFVSYTRLQTLVQRLNAHDLLTFQTIDIGQKVDAMANAAADEQYRTAEKALSAGRWAGAVKGYTEALSFKADYKDSTAKLAQSYYGWGADDLGKKAWRSGAEHYAAANATVAGYQDAAAQSARIYRALGRDFKTRGLCRQAVRDLRQAQGLAADPKVGDELDAALSCATSRVGVADFANPTHNNPGGLAVGDALSALLIVSIGKGASEFVRIEAADSTSMGRLSTWPGPLYQVSGKLLQVKEDRPVTTTTEREADVDQRVPCPPGSGKAEDLCLVPTRIHYFERHLRTGLSIEASLSLQDVHASTTALSEKFQGSVSDETRWADGVTQGGKPAAIATADNVPGLVLPSSLIELMAAPHEPRAPDVLAREVLDQISTAIAAKVRPVVDAEPAATDAATLVLP